MQIIQKHAKTNADIPPYKTYQKSRTIMHIHLARLFDDNWRKFKHSVGSRDQHLYTYSDLQQFCSYCTANSHSTSNTQVLTAAKPSYDSCTIAARRLLILCREVTSIFYSRTTATLQHLGSQVTGNLQPEMWLPVWLGGCCPEIVTQVQSAKTEGKRCQYYWQRYFVANVVHPFTLACGWCGPANITYMPVLD